MNELATRNCEIASTPHTDALLHDYLCFIDREPTTQKGYLTCLKQFIRWMMQTGKIDVLTLTREDVLAYKAYLDGATFGRSGTEHLKAGTKQQYLRAARHFLAWVSVRTGKVNVAENIHTAKVRHDRHRKDALSHAEAAAIEQTIDRTTEQGKRLYALYLLGARRGLRTVEMSRLSVKDLHKKGDTVYIDIWGKGHSEPDATRVLDPDTAAAIEDYLQSRTDQYTQTSPLFVSTSNKGKPGTKLYRKDATGKRVLDRVSDGRIAPTTISTMLKGALVNAGYDSDRLTAHSLRHTAGTEAVNNGDIHAAQIFLRHDDIKNTQIYTHIDELERDKALTMKIYNSYHDSENEAAQRQEAMDILATLPADKLQAAREYLIALV